MGTWLKLPYVQFRSADSQNYCGTSPKYCFSIWSGSFAGTEDQGQVSLPRNTMLAQNSQVLIFSASDVITDNIHLIRLQRAFKQVEYEVDANLCKTIVITQYWKEVTL